MVKKFLAQDHKVVSSFAVVSLNTKEFTDKIVYDCNDNLSFQLCKPFCLAYILDENKNTADFDDHCRKTAQNKTAEFNPYFFPGRTFGYKYKILFTTKANTIAEATEIMLLIV